MFSDPAEIISLIDRAAFGIRRLCEFHPDGSTGRPEDLQRCSDHLTACSECQGYIREVRDFKAASYRSLIRWTDTGQLPEPEPVPDTAEPEDDALYFHCAFCGKRFQPRRTTARYCSDNHRRMMDQRKRQAEKHKATEQQY
jgi:hypothetical protein